MRWSAAVEMVLFGCGTVSFKSRKFYRQFLSGFVLVRTGQAHRTLLGHTAPVTCLQFDELHIVSGSLDKTIRVRILMAFEFILYLC